jgi:hypothetical protein
MTAFLTVTPTKETPLQTSLNEGEGSVRLTFSLSLLALLKKLIMF